MNKEYYEEEIVVEDEEESELTLDSFKNTSTLSLDLNVDTIGMYYERKKFVFDPDFQRRYVWDDKRKSKFIESLILNVPIPSILLADDKNKNEYIIIDGKQRLSTIIEFLAPEKDGDGLKLKGLEILKELNGFTYKKLMEESKYVTMLSTLQTYIIKTTIIKNYSSKLLYFVFARLNSGSVPLSTQELRHSLFPGEFSNFINKKSSDNEYLKKILKLKPTVNDSRMKDAELLCRYYAFKYYLNEYKSTVGELLDLTYEKLNRNWIELKDSIENDLIEFNNSVKFVYDIFGDDAFKLFSKENKNYGSFNRLVFDLLSVWFSNSRYRDAVNKSSLDFKKEFEKMFDDEVFDDAFKPVTSSGIKTKNRFERFNTMFRNQFGE